MAIISIEINLDSIDTPSLIDELESRGIDIDDGSEKELFEAIYGQIILGSKDKALETMHDFLREKLGKTL